MPVLAVDHVTKTFSGRGSEADVLALDRVSLDVDAGEILCVVGPSGCGKTTLLNILAGFEPATEGAATFRGEEITRPGPERGVVFQEAALFPWLSALDNIQFGLKEQGMSRHERTQVATRHLEMVGLAGAGDRRPAALSGGMRQRVALARALANGASALLLDEPFGALDAQTRTQMHTELLSLWEQTDTTMLLITHAIDEAVLLADRVAVMAPDPGRVMEVVDVDLDRPRDDTSVAFNDLKRRVRELITASMTAGATS